MLVTQSVEYQILTLKVAGSSPAERVMEKKKKETDKDMFGTPKNRAKTWDIKKNRDTKKDRRESKRVLKKG